MTEFILLQLFPITKNWNSGIAYLGDKKQAIKNLISVQKTDRHYIPMYCIQNNDGLVSNPFSENGIGSLEETRHFCIVNTLVKLSAFPQSHEGKKFTLLQPESKLSV